jgi:hypothetical protein
VAPSKRPIVDLFGTTWLGDPETADFSIEIADEYIGLSAPSGETRVRWSDIAALDVDIPTASWGLAVTSHRIIETLDALTALTSNGLTTTSETNHGTKDIEVRISLKDGTEVTGWAHKHQLLGYPKPEAEAAIAILRGRVGGPAA